MAIKIHHGPPGTYKTSGAVMDDVIPAIKAGRTIVTNIRGLTQESILSVFPDSESEVITLDSSKTADNAKLARWFHWMPLGALLILDECQSVFPKAWSQSDINLLEYPGGLEAATADKRPHNWSTAWEMHRHYNWDIVLTTVSIKLVRTDICECAEAAYRHRNRAIIGLSGRYSEGFHLAMVPPSDANIISQENKKISAEVWKMYQSTATGQVADSKAGVQIYKNPKVVISVLFAALCLIGGAFGVANSTFLEKAKQHDLEVNKNKREQKENKNITTTVKRVVPKLDPYNGVQISIAGVVMGKTINYLFSVSTSSKPIWLTSKDFIDMGYSIEPQGVCFARLIYQGIRRDIICRLPGEVRTGLPAGALASGGKSVF